MAEALTHPTHGYYMSRDVFGTQGDFVTSPEVSQMFGEMLGVWAAALWDSMGRPPRLLLVELGPGRGTLLADALRATRRLPGFAAALDIHLVEVSPAMRQLQAARLGCNEPGAGAMGAGTLAPPGAGATRVTWHSALATVPEGPLVLLAHEFFDALPVQQFERTERGWVERLVGVALSLPGPAPSPRPREHRAPSGDGPQVDAPDGDDGALRFVRSPRPTPAARLLVPWRLGGCTVERAEAARALEISPKSLSLWEEVAQRARRPFLPVSRLIVVAHCQNSIYCLGRARRSAATAAVR